MTQGQKATEVQLHLKMPPRIGNDGPDSSDFILFNAIQHMSIPQFVCLFVGCSHNSLFQTTVVAVREHGQKTWQATVHGAADSQTRLSNWAHRFLCHRKHGCLPESFVSSSFWDFRLNHPDPTHYSFLQRPGSDWKFRNYALVTIIICPEILFLWRQVTGKVACFV